MRSTRRFLSQLFTLAIVCVLSLVWASTAFAAPTTTWSGEAPARGAVLAAPSTGQSVNVACTADLIGSTRQFTVDGVKYWSSYSNPTGGGSWVWGEVWDDDAEEWVGDWKWVASPDLKHAALSANPPAISTDGTHTVSVSVANTGGTSSTNTWTFAIRIPPTLGAPSPADGAYVSTTSPTIEIPAADNSAVASWTATINGAAVAATFSGGKVRVTLPTALRNDSYNTVSVSVRDALGLQTTRSWAFTAEVYPEMIGVPGTCDTCHPGDATDNDMGPQCSRCHTGDHQGSPASQHAKADVSTCSPCHVSDITIEHARHLTKQGAAITCATCHTSADPKVVGAIASGNTACSACHDTSSGHESLHTTTVPPSCAGSGCHSGTSLTTLHINAGTTLSCATCHKSTDPNVNNAIATHNKDCSACHVTMHPGMSAKHAVTSASSACTDSGCHGTDITVIHGASTDTSRCAVCHSLPDIASKTADCSSCHSLTSPHGDEAAKHALSMGSGEVPMNLDNSDHGAGMTISEDCTLCHYDNLEAQHANKCSICHTAGKAPTAFAGSWNKTCQQGDCHPSIHTATSSNHYDVYNGSSASCMRCHDTSAGDFPGPGDNCSRCHDPAYTAASVGDHTAPVTTSDAQATYNGTAFIKLAPTDSGSGVSQTFFSIDGHAYALGTDIQVAAPASGSKAHSVSFYSADHAMNVESVKNVTFTSFAPTPDTTPPTTTSSFNPASGAVFNAAQSVTLTAADNVGGRGVKSTSYKIDSGAFASGTSFSVTGDGLHTFSYYSVDNANNTEATHVSNQFRIDTVAPVTANSAVGGTAYIGAQTFTLSPTDVGGSGVASTSYRLDGGAWATGSSVIVAAPASGSVAHAIDWYSVDNATNKETTQTVTFTVAAPLETIPPTTSSDFNPAAGAVYNSAQSVNLTATDNTGGTGVKTTYYRIDSGAFVAGTSFTVSGDGLHTFSYYSVDNANNVESTHVSNQFRIDTVAPVTTNSAVSGTTYTGSQTFTLAASDVGGSGVAATSYQLDGGAWSTGSSVIVAAPSSGSVPHTIAWYSTDVATNKEATQTVTFTVKAPAAASGSIFLDLYNTEMDVNWADEGGYDYTYVVSNAGGTAIASGTGHSGDTITDVPVGGPYTVDMSFESVNYGTLDFQWTGVSVANATTTTLTRNFRDWW